MASRTSGVSGGGIALRLELDIQARALHLRDVALDGRDDADIVEVRRAQREDDPVQLVHGPGEEIADPVQAVASWRIGAKHRRSRPSATRAPGRGHR